MANSEPLKPLIIGLVGKGGAGKTETAKYLTQHYKFQEVVFAEPVKRVTSIIFGFDYDMLLGDTPEKRKRRTTEKDLIWGLTPVEAMQRIGTEIFRENFDRDTWIKIAQRQIQQAISNGVNVVISDCRFENEMEFIRSMGGELWVLFQNVDDIDPQKTEELQQTHISEKSFQNSVKDVDRKIHNPRDGLDNLYTKIDDILKEHPAKQK